MQRLRYQRLVLVITLILALLIVELVPRVSQVTSPLQFIGGWVGRGFYLTSQTIKSGVARAVFGADAQKIISDLEYQIELLGNDKETIASVKAENIALKEAVSFIEEVNYEVMMTRVIGHDPNNPQTRLRINAGSRNGIQTGSAVTTPSGVMIGVIVDTQERLSTVELLRNPALTIPVRLPAKPDTFGLLQSPDGFSLHITQVPKEGDLASGDIVVTNSGFRLVPPNLSVGVVGVVREDPESLWQQAQVVPYVDTRSLDYLLVVKPS